MIKMMLYIAHAGELHQTTTQTTTHIILSDWYIALPLFIACMAGIITLIYFLTNKSKATTFMIVTSILFVIGIASYRVSAPISIVALSAGFGLVLLQVLLGLGKS